MDAWEMGYREFKKIALVLNIYKCKGGRNRMNVVSDLLGDGVAGGKMYAKVVKSYDLEKRVLRKVIVWIDGDKA